jgi:peptidyl-tRNA hydrolase ICT1
VVIHAASSVSVKNEPTEAQKNRVAALERAEEASRWKAKSHRSDIKKGRASRKEIRGDWD